MDTTRMKLANGIDSAADKVFDYWDIFLGKDITNKLRNFITESDPIERPMSLKSITDKSLNCWKINSQANSL